MRFRLIDLFTWTAAIAVVLFFILRVIAPILEERQISHVDAVLRATAAVLLALAIGYSWLRTRVVTPRDRLLLRCTIFGAMIGAWAGSLFGLGQYFLSWRPEIAQELGPAVGTLLGLVPGAIAGMYAGRIADHFQRVKT